MNDHQADKAEKAIQALEENNNLRPEDVSERVRQVSAPENMIDYHQWKSCIREHFPDLVFASEVSASIMAQLLIKDITNPFALVLVDVPSAGKTIAINFFAEIEGLTYASDKFTPAAFVSNSSNVKKKDLKDIDLLPRLKYKMFLIRDLATLFSKRDDDLNDCLGTLTRVLDGEGLSCDTGVHGQRGYVGEYLFMILAASTPIPHKVMKMMGNLGSRLFFLNINSRDKSEETLADQLSDTAYKEKEKTCRAITKEFLTSLWFTHKDGAEWDKTADTKDLRLIISRCAKLLAGLRGVINVYREKDLEEKYEYTIPVIEKPDRINQLFYNLCRGHALICGRKQIIKDDLKLIIELALDSAPRSRAKLFRKLLDNDGMMHTSQVEEELDCSKPTALKEMETLRILGICEVRHDSIGKAGEPEKSINLKPEFAWFLSDEFRAIRGKAQSQKPLIDNQSTESDTVETVFE